MSHPALTATTLRERPELLEPALRLGMLDATVPFLGHNLVGHIASPSRFRTLWPGLAVVLVDDRGEVAARAFAVCYASAAGHRGAGLPQHGWEAALVWAAEDRLEGRSADVAAAVTVTVGENWRGQGVSGTVLAALAAAARREGLSQLACPVRPPAKAAEPLVPMEEYARRTRPDGLPADPWLRAHARAGGVIDSVAPFAMTIQGTLEQWRQWTGLPFDQDGPVVVPGALVPVIVSTALRAGIYLEPNVWVRYPL